MAKKGTIEKPAPKPAFAAPGRPSALLDTRVVYCGDNLEQLAEPTDVHVDLNHIEFGTCERSRTAVPLQLRRTATPEPINRSD